MPPSSRPRSTAHPTDPGYLRGLFSRNARTYDAVNVAISLGQVRRWRREVVTLARIPAGGRVLDAFAGPGSLAEPAAARMGPPGELVLVDLSPAMLDQARLRLARQDHGDGGLPQLRFVAADLLHTAEDLGRFDAVLLGFGLRYVADPVAALRRLRRLLSPGGRLAVLEFTRPSASAAWAVPAQAYFHHLLPPLAARLAGEAELYEYLRDSSAGFLTPGELGAALDQAGWTPLRSRVHLGGLVTVVVAVTAAKAAEEAGERRIGAS